jgi:hypothetical protein
MIGLSDSSISGLLANFTRFDRKRTPMNSAVRMTEEMLCVMMKNVAPVSFCAVTTSSSR